MYNIYVLQSIKYGRYYIGYSCDIEKRLIEHNAWFVKSTKFYKPYNLIYTEEFKTKTEALKREKELKRMKWSENFKKIIHPL